MSNRSRRWCFTINNPKEGDEAHCKQLVTDGVLTYVIYGREKGEKGTPHLQGYAESKNARTLGGMRKLIPRAHFEIARGSPDQNRTYCSKEDSFEEWGSISRQGARTDLQEVRALIQTSGSIRKCLETAQSYQSVRMAEKILDYTVVKRSAPPVVIWISGPTGVGKTRCAWDLYGSEDTWAWNNSNWFDGYDGHKTVIFDDYRGDELAFPLVLRLTDRYPVRVPIKGGFRPWCPERIIFTSPLTSRDAHGHQRGEALEQLLRRITVEWTTESDGHPDVEQVRIRVEQETASPEVTVTTVPNTPGQD